MTHIGHLHESYEVVTNARGKINIIYIYLKTQ